MKSENTLPTWLSTGQGVLLGYFVAFPDSRLKGWRYIKDWKLIASRYNAPQSVTWYVSWLRHLPHVRSLPRAGLTLFPILLGCLFVCLVCLVTHRILSAVSSKAELQSDLLSVLKQPASFSLFLGPSCPRAPSLPSIRNDHKSTSVVQCHTHEKTDILSSFSRPLLGRRWKGICSYLSAVSFRSCSTIRCCNFYDYNVLPALESSFCYRKKYNS